MRLTGFASSSGISTIVTTCAEVATARSRLSARSALGAVLARMFATFIN